MAPYLNAAAGRMLRLALLLTATLLLAGATNSAVSSEARIVGTASVIDGDTLEIHGQRIRLHGIDAPESGQTCKTSGGASYRCGQKAALALSDEIGRTSIECRGRGTDRYKRTIAVCFKAGKDLNGWLVRLGWAVAYTRYSTDYVDEERAARSDHLGLWQGDFVRPEAWRTGSRTQMEPIGQMRFAETKDCCVRCSKGVPCGNSCIAPGKRCRKEPGCAC